MIAYTRCEDSGLGLTIIGWLAVATLAVGLPGCNPATPADAGLRTTAPNLRVAKEMPLETELPHMLPVQHLTFSRDGELILAVDGRAQVALFSHTSGELLTSLDGEPELRFERGNLIKAGLLDDDTAFYLAWNKGLFEIWNIAPTTRRFTHRFSAAGLDTAAANADYIAHGDAVLNRHTGALLDGAFLASSLVNIDYQLTDGDLLFSASPINRDMVLTDLDEGTQDIWDSSRVHMAAFTSSQRYLVAAGSRCQVWRLPNPEPVYQCGSRWPLAANVHRIATHPTEDLFAVYQGKSVRVYALDPFRKLLDIKAPDQVVHLALTVNNRLVLADRKHHLEVWDIADQTLVGTYASTSIDTLAAHPTTGDVLIAGDGDRHGLFLLTADAP
ncbi:MAG: hypothetical protein WED00_03695 [Aquisalimonadaceae bacterium]